MGQIFVEGAFELEIVLRIEVVDPLKVGERLKRPINCQGVEVNFHEELISNVNFPGEGIAEIGKFVYRRVTLIAWGFIDALDPKFVLVDSEEQAVHKFYAVSSRANWDWVVFVLYSLPNAYSWWSWRDQNCHTEELEDGLLNDRLAVQNQLLPEILWDSFVLERSFNQVEATDATLQVE